MHTTDSILIITKWNRNKLLFKIKMFPYINIARTFRQKYKGIRMPAQLTLITTKPLDVVWWWTTNPDKMAAIETWFRSLPGFVSYSTSMPFTNVREQTLVFDTILNLHNYLSQIYQQPEAVERKLFNDQNKISTVVKIDVI